MKLKYWEVLFLLPLSAASVSAQTTFPVSVSGAVVAGGVPCFNTTTQESSSPTLPANYVVLGGGEGACPQTSPGLFSDPQGDLTSNSVLTNLFNSNGANDLVVEDNSVERLRLLQSGHPTISLTINKPAGYLYPNEPGNGTTPSPATVQIFSASTDDGKGGPFDQLSLTNPLATNRRAAIMLQSYCSPTSLTSCVPDVQTDEWELGSDIAPNGTRSFFIFDEVNEITSFYAGPYQTVSLGTTAVVGGVGNPNGAGIQGDVTVRRLNAAGSIPRCSLGAGWGSGSSCAFENGSTDTAGVLLITTGNSPNTNGTAMITWSEGSNFGQNAAAVCVANLFNDVANFNAGATVILNNRNLQTSEWIVDNHNARFIPSTADAYGVAYICIGK